MDNKNNTGDRNSGKVTHDKVVISFIVPVAEDTSNDLNFLIRANGKCIAALPVGNKRAGLSIGRRYFFEISKLELAKLLTLDT